MSHLGPKLLSEHTYACRLFETAFWILRLQRCTLFRRPTSWDSFHTKKKFLKDVTILLCNMSMGAIRSRSRGQGRQVLRCNTLVHPLGQRHTRVGVVYGQTPSFPLLLASQHGRKPVLVDKGGGIRTWKNTEGLKAGDKE